VTVGGNAQTQSLSWKQVLLDDVATRGSGHTPDKKRADYWNGGIPWVSLKDTFRLDRGPVLTTTETITRMGLANSSAVVHPMGSVVLLRDAGIGKSAVLGADMAVSQHFMAWNCGPRLDNWYLYYYLQYMKPEFERISNGSTIKTIGLDYFRQLAIPLPAVEEQRLIAQVMTGIDDHISSLERMIAKKQAIKQGMMQQLLTGRSRLPGFTRSWTKARLGDFATMGSGGTPPSGTARFYGGGVPWVSISDMTNAGKYVRRTEKTLSQDGLTSSAARLYDERVVLYAMYASLGECALPIGRMASSQAILGILPDRRLDREFLYYYLVALRPKVKEMGQHGAQPNLNAEMVRRFSIELPSLDEQQAIASILSDADSELDKLEDRLEKAVAVKQGMMQQLLTGRTRLRPKGSAA
jgi:type I restriction enzyme, S subunit